MRITTMVFVLLAITGLAPVVQAKDAQDILQSMQQKQLERWDGVDDYLVDMAVMGHSTQMYFQRTEITDDNGEKQTLFLPISQNQRTTGSCSSGAVQMTPEAWEAYAQGAEMTGAGLGETIESGLEDAGLPRGLLAATGSEPTATLDPRVMMGSGAMFARAAAESQRRQAQEGARNEADAEQQADQMAQFMATAQLIGTESVNGRKAYHLKSDKLQVQQGQGGEQFNPDVMSLWVDAEDYVPLRMSMEGTMTADGETRPMMIETLMTDYRTVPGSSMYESYKQTMKIAGMMNAAQEAEMQEAAKKMAEFEKQMASMPANQRAMMENMMGPQMEAMRSMASGGGFQTESVIRSIQVNPPMVAEDGSACPVSAPKQQVNTAADEEKAEATADIMDRGMTEMVQQDLARLGYDPGPVTGEMNTATAIAISKFQAENKMAVTGAITPQLAGVLAARADNSAAPAAATPAVAAPAAMDPAALQAAQQACLQEKVAAAQEAQKKKRGLGRLVSGISRAAGKFAGADVASTVAETSSNVYTANATAEDFGAAAKDLGLTEDEVVACQNPL